MEKIIHSLTENYIKKLEDERVSFYGLPEEENIEKLIHSLRILLFPECVKSEREEEKKEIIRHHMDEAYKTLFLLSLKIYSLKKEKSAEEKAKKITVKLLENLYSIRSSLLLDAEAAFNGDPAAKSIIEIILSYPGFKAITVHRIGHFLYSEKLPLLPRMLNEVVHAQTGIDIHPGAKIGSYFFIDHGTGVVIGETTEIGDRVKIYQGVTLGALSFPKDGCGLLLKGQKRHPKIEDDVTIYANATILGPVVIGKGSTIGSNSWIKENIAPYSTVIPKKVEYSVRQVKTQEEK